MDDETVKTTINSTELKNDSTNEDVSLHTDSSTTSSSSPTINSFRIQIVEPQTEHNNSKESSNKAKISNPSNLANNVGTNPSQVPEILTTSPPGESTPQGHNNFSSQDINMLTPNSNRTTVSGSPTLSPSNYNSDSSNLASPTTPLSTQKGSPPAGLFNSFSVNPQGKTTTGQPQSPSPVKAKPYVCTECNQTFSRQHNLKSHALTHSQEKPFQCEVCQHFFRRHHDLKRHAKLHTGEKPYQCPHCKRSFARLDALNRHLRAESFCGAPQKKLYQTSTNGQQQPSQQQTEQKVEQPQQIQSQPQQQQPLPPPQQKQHKQQIDKNVESQVNKSPTLQSESQRQSQENFQQVQQEQYKQWQQHQQIQMQKVPSNLNNSNRIGQIVFPVESVAKTSPTNIQRYSIQYAQDPQQRIVDDPLKIDPDVDTIIINRRTSAMSQLEIQLKERNDYLEDRVRQLENEVINERKLRNRRELLEEQVRKLEIEKNLLKSLLLERSNRGPADIVPAGSGGYDIELTKRSEKKRKASYLGELSSSPKHQKDYDGATVIPQSAQ